jgi:hypothetical protein
LIPHFLNPFVNTAPSWIESSTLRRAIQLMPQRGAGSARPCGNCTFKVKIKYYLCFKTLHVGMVSDIAIDNRKAFATFQQHQQIVTPSVDYSIDKVRALMIQWPLSDWTHQLGTCDTVPATFCLPILSPCFQVRTENKSRYIYQER